MKEFKASIKLENEMYCREILEGNKCLHLECASRVYCAIFHATLKSDTSGKVWRIGACKDLFRPATCQCEIRKICE